MSTKRKSNKNSLFVYDDKQKEEGDKSVFVFDETKKEESMESIFNLTNNKTFSKEIKPVKVVDSWGAKPKK